LVGKNSNEKEKTKPDQEGPNASSSVSSEDNGNIIELPPKEKT
jgi:hypothetical protein